MQPQLYLELSKTGLNRKRQHHALSYSRILLTSFVYLALMRSKLPITLLVPASESLFGLGLCLSVFLGDGPTPDLALLEDRRAGRDRLCESEWRFGAVLVKVVGSSGRSITASPEWGSRYKAPIALRSLSLLCGRPPRSSPPPPRLWANSRAAIISGIAHQNDSQRCICEETQEEISPEKHSRKSCSSLRARSIPFLACSSVRRVLISLPGTKSLSDRAISPRPARVFHRGSASATHRTFSSDLGRTNMAMG